MGVVARFIQNFLRSAASHPAAREGTMTDNVNSSRSLRSAAWALARVSCVGLLFLATANCLPAPTDDNTGGTGGGNSSAGGNSGNPPNPGTTNTGGFAKTGGITSVTPTGGYNNPTGGYNNPTGGYVYPTGGYMTPTGGYAYPTGGSITPTGGSITPTGGSVTPTGGSVTPAGGSIAITCTPVPKSTGGLSCPGKKCVAGTYSGYNFSFTDGKTSTVCMSPESLCAAGVTGAQDPPAYSDWGAGFGFNLSPDTTLTSIVELQLPGTGVSVTVSSLPTGADMRVQVTVAGTDYCAKMTTASATLAWTSFNTKCWDNSGTALPGAPKTAKIQFQAASGTAAGSFDFCVTALTFQ